MANAISANKAELIAIANSVASEKMIDKVIVIEAMEDAIQRAARARYGAENDIRAKLDPDSGDLRLWRVVEVVETVEDYFKQVDLKQGQKLKKDAVIGDFIVDPLPAIDLGRIDAQNAENDLGIADPVAPGDGGQTLQVPIHGLFGADGGDIGKIADRQQGRHQTLGVRQSPPGLAPRVGIVPQDQRPGVLIDRQHQHRLRDGFREPEVEFVE